MFHFNKNFGLFVGKLEDNTYHKHYALQISVSANSTMKLMINGEQLIKSDAIFINSNIEHSLTSESNHLTILINPLSSIGHHIYLKFRKVSHEILNETLSKELIKLLTQFENKEIGFKQLSYLISKELSKYQCACELENHFEDDRIISAIKFMDDNFEKVLSLEEVSAHCYLSPTRFLHLFKEKTNLTFRRYQLWNKLINSLPSLMNNSITDTAFEFGFSDNSHYTRTFKESFGVTPKFFTPKL